MDNSAIVFLINDEARAVYGIYEDDGQKTIFKTLDQAIKVGDFAVVESTTRHNMTVVKITDVDVDVNFETDKSIRWVVQVIDTDRFKETLMQERAAISAVQEAERARKKKELRASLFANHEDKIKALALAKSDDLPLAE